LKGVGAILSTPKVSKTAFGFCKYKYKYHINMAGV
jgi:hypothetical protein